MIEGHEIKKIYDEYKDILCYEPLLLKESLQNYYGDNFVVDYNLENSDIIISPSDLNAYYTIKELNKDKKDGLSWSDVDRIMANY